MTDFKVKIPIQGIVDLKTDEAEAKMRRLDQLSSSGQHTGLPPTVFGESPTARAGATLSQSFGSNFSFMQNRRQINALVRQEHQTVRDLGEAYERVKNLQDATGKQQAGHIKRQIDHHRSLAQAMRTVQMVGEGKELAGVGGGPRTAMTRGGSGRMSMLMQQMTLRQALQGGAFTGGAGGLGRMLMSSPWIAGAAAAVGGPVLAYHLANSFSEPAERIQTDYLNAARRMGDGQSSLMGRFGTPGNAGRVKQRLLDLGYTHHETSRALSAFGVPSTNEHTQRAVETQLEFARRFGMGDSPEMVSGMGRQMALMGVAPNRQPAFFKQLAATNLFGQERGVDSTDMTKGVMGLLSKIADNTGLLTPARVTGAMAMAMKFATGNRMFQGERGMNRLNTMMSGFTNPRSIQGVAMMNNAIREVFDGELPSGKDLGFGGSRAAAFDSLPDIIKQEVIRENMNTLPGQVGSKIFRQLSKNTDPRLQALLLKSFSGFNGTQTLEAMTSLNESTGKTKSGVLSNMADLSGGLADTVTRDALRTAQSQEFEHQGFKFRKASDVERSRALTQTMMDLTSEQISKETMAKRLGIKAGAEEMLSDGILKFVRGLEIATEALHVTIKSVSLTPTQDIAMRFRGMFANALDDNNP